MLDSASHSWVFGWLDCINNNVTNGVGILSSQSITDLEKHYGSPVLDVNGNSVCGRGKAEDGTPCRMSAGWGTDHSGFGACKYHDSEERMELAVPKGSVLYSHITGNTRLRNHLIEEEKRSELDNLDGEIILLRAMLKILVEKYGEKTVDGETLDIIELGSHFADVSLQTRELTALVDKISAAIKRKYEVMQIAGSTITRDRVREYMTNIQLALGQVLRNECSSCHESHGQRDSALEAIRRVGDI